MSIYYLQNEKFTATTWKSLYLRNTKRIDIVKRILLLNCQKDQPNTILEISDISDFVYRLQTRRFQTR